MRGALHRTLVVIGGVLLLLLGAYSSELHAQSGYPNKKITMVVGFAPGGGVDTLARVVAQEITEQFGTQVIVENRPGAGSNIAAKVVATAPADGYTLFFTGNSYAINQTIYRNPGYATADLRAIAIPALDSQALTVAAGNPAKTLADFLAAAKEKPPAFGFGGSSSRLIAEYVLKVMAKTQAVAVPFQSGAPAINALLGNHVDLISAPISEVVPHVQQGAMRVLAVSGAYRVAAFPDAPTLKEAGLPGLEINGWLGILAPAKTPDDVCATFNAAVNATIAKASVTEKLRALGYDPRPMPLAETGPFLTTSIETWRKMILATGMNIIE